MAIGSLGSSGYEERLRALEERRAKELERIEERYRDQVDRVEALRENQIRDIYENQASETDQKRRDADERLAKIKAATDEKIREFQTDSSRLADQARHQYQEKADLLVKNARELDQQRQFMVKQQEEALKDLSREHEERYLESKNKHDREAENIYNQQRYRTQEAQLKGEAEIEKVTQDIQGRRERELIEGQRKIDGMRDQFDSARASHEDQMMKEEKVSQDQLERLRANHQYVRDNLESEFSGNLAIINRKNQAEANRVLKKSQQQMEDIKNDYFRKISEIERDTRKGVADKQTHNQAQLQALETDARTQQHLAQKNFEFVRQKSDEKRQELLKAALDEDEKVKKDLTSNHQLKRDSLVEKHRHQLDSLSSEIQDSLGYLNQVGKHQLNTTLTKYREQVEEHGKKQNDPFYHVHEFDASVSDGSSEVVVEIKVPEHEKDRVRLSWNQGMLLLSGSRSAESRATSDGRKLSTNTFQSFSEGVPINGHLDMKRMVRTWNPDKSLITYKIPKI